jgi:chromosomal replication initiator protein
MTRAPESVCAPNGLVSEVLATLQERIGPGKFNAWFRHGTRVSLEEGRVKVSVPNPFVANWIETHYHAEIASAAARHTSGSWPVVVTVDPSLTGELRRSHLDTQAEMVSKAAQGLARPRRSSGPVELKYSLKDFVVGAGNRLAYSAAVAVVGQDKAPFNPLFLHGPCGVGKTHLLQSICNAAARQQRSGRAMAWRYVTGEQFTNEFITALRAKKICDFRARYRKLDLLAIDDVHFLAAKRATQDEFLHTYNAIESAGRQVVMASDAPPQLVGELNAQLLSRFTAGMVVKIDPPDQATRIEILRRRAKAMNLPAEDDALQYVARHMHGSVRELEGALVKLAALSALEGQRVTVELAAKALAEHLARTDSAITLGDIEAVTATFFGITPADIHSSRRTKTVSAARMVAMFLARRHTQMSYPEIGRAMGKNHSSAVLAVQRMEALLAKRGRIHWTGPMGGKSQPAKEVVELLTEQIA